MITPADLDRLKKLLATAAPTPLLASVMDSRGQRYMVSSTGSGRRVVATSLTKGDAEMLVAAWTAMPKLIAEIERLRRTVTLMNPPPVTISGMTGPALRTTADAVADQQGRRTVGGRKGK